MSTVYRYLRTLVGVRLRGRTGGTFRLGPKLLIGTGANVTSEQLIRHADPVLRRLVAATGETAIVVRRVGLASVCMHAIESGLAPAGDLPDGLDEPAATPGRRPARCWHSPRPRCSTRSCRWSSSAMTEATLDADDLRDSLAQVVHYRGRRERR